MGAFAQFAATSQFFLYGRRHCTSTGYLRAASGYGGGADLHHLDLSGKVFAVTGANSGVGRSLAGYFAARGGTVYMLCRSKERAAAARDEIVGETSNPNVHVILADLSLRSDCRRAIGELAAHASRLDCLVCNAGVLLNERTETAEGHEVTFATHLLCGSYLLPRLALPLLRKAADPRVVFVSSGGMYNTRWPGGERGSCSAGQPYNGQLAYAYAKRGQVLLAERLSKLLPAVTFVSCHPGWADTPAVEAAYGAAKRLLAPMRTPWQGAEGIAWLAVCPRDELEPGGFYLDRRPQAKHMAGPFFSEGSFTKNSEEEVGAMLRLLDGLAGLEPLGAVDGLSSC